MHPSQATIFRKTIIAAILIAFSGGLLVFTAMSNLRLLQSVYPDPQFYTFGLLALEGGVVAWLALFMLFLDGARKGVAVIALSIDVIISCTGFFYEMERITSAVGTVPLPSIIVVVAFAVIFNVVMGLICKMVPGNAVIPPPPVRPKEAERSAYTDGYQGQEAAFAQTGDVTEPGRKGPGFFVRVAASAVDTRQQIRELAEEKRRQRQSAPDPLASALLDDEQAQESDD